MAEDKIKISELTTSQAYSDAFVPGIDTYGDTKKFPLDPLADIGNKVDKVNGKGLSTNDYTNAEKSKLAGIPDIESITNAEIDALFN